MEPIHKLRKNFKDTKIIAITGVPPVREESFSFAEAAAMAFGADQSFVKPVIINELLDAVASLLPNNGGVH